MVLRAHNKVSGSIVVYKVTWSSPWRRREGVEGEGDQITRPAGLVGPDNGNRARMRGGREGR